jgi:hypothetical protein
VVIDDPAVFNPDTWPFAGLCSYGEPVEQFVEGEGEGFEISCFRICRKDVAVHRWFLIERTSDGLNDSSLTNLNKHMVTRHPFADFFNCTSAAFDPKYHLLIDQWPVQSQHIAFLSNLHMRT